MNDYNWLRVRILQYLLFKGDLLKQIAEESTCKLHNSRKLTSQEYSDIYRNLLKHELFEEIYNDILGLL